VRVVLADPCANLEDFVQSGGAVGDAPTITDDLASPCKYDLQRATDSTSLVQSQLFGEQRNGRIVDDWSMLL
jgi:hypothetical protein